MLSRLLILLSCLSCLCRADNLFEAEPGSSSSLEEQDEARTFFTSNGNYYLALNTTYLLFYVALFGIGLIAALALASLFGGTEESGYGYGYQQGGYDRNQGYHGHHHSHYRQRRSYDGGES